MEYSTLFRLVKLLLSSSLKWENGESCLSCTHELFNNMRVKKKNVVMNMIIGDKTVFKDPSGGKENLSWNIRIVIISDLVISALDQTNISVYITLFANRCFLNCYFISTDQLKNADPTDKSRLRPW